VVLIVSDQEEVEGSGCRGVWHLVQ
jgi:hypothetical protein